MEYLNWCAEHPFLTFFLAMFASRFSQLFWFSRTKVDVDCKAKFGKGEKQ